MPLHDLTNNLALTPSPPLCRQRSEWRGSPTGTEPADEDGDSVARLLAASRRELQAVLEANTLSRPYCTSSEDEDEDEDDGEERCGRGGVAVGGGDGHEACSGGTEARKCEACEHRPEIEAEAAPAPVTASSSELAAQAAAQALREQLAGAERELSRLRVSNERLAGDNQALHIDLTTTVDFLERAKPILEPYLCSGQLPFPSAAVGACCHLA